jgi:cytosine/adenosine deaminase-related metal-dependent hydrolase|tara:strand:+ start:578 stop:1996 length:1419 start_codon:yes stop_codon:yes gene_type:complete
LAIEIRNGTVIAWNGTRHEVIDPGVVVFEGSKIIFVGSAYDGNSDEIIDASGRLVIPGLINSHLHVTDTPYTQGYLEDIGDRDPAGSATNLVSLYKVLPEVRHATDPEAQVAAAECAFAELARTGSTTVVELGYDGEIGGDGDIAITEQVADVAGRIGLRCYSGPRYRTRHYGQNSDGTIFYKDYPDRGRRRFEACIEFCEQWNGRFGDRLRTMLAPGQIDTCDAELLRDTRRTADELHLPIQLHAGQSKNEFQRIGATENRTTVEYLEGCGLLGPDFIIGHGQIISGDGDASSMAAHEIVALRDSQTTICHLPWVKARRGNVINSIQKYKDLGIRQCLGTDTFPFDLFNDMRMAAVVCKIVEKAADAAPSEDVFAMATTGGADALGRPDLGRLAPGCRADIVMVRIDTPKAAPVYDPFKFLVLSATGEDIDRVIVDGHTIVQTGEVQTLDVPAAVRRLNDASKRVWARLDL